MSQTSPNTYNYKMVEQFTITTGFWGIFGISGGDKLPLNWYGFWHRLK